MLRAAGEILDETQFIIIGSQSILGKFPDAPPELLRSVEADLISKNKRSQTDALNVIGELSQFHDTHGYYVDPVSEDTAILPKGWKGRLVNLTVRRPTVSPDFAFTHMTYSSQRWRRTARRILITSR